MENILYLEDGDLNLNNWKLDISSLKRMIGKNSQLHSELIFPNIIESSPIVIFIYGNFCGYCHKMMPEFQQLADSAGIFRHPGITSPSPKGNIIPTAILIDGSQKEQTLGKAIQQKIPGFRGVPCVIKIENGNMTVYNGERTYQGLVNFIS